MTRSECLREAAARVGPRAEQYGKPEDNFQAIARLWNAYLKNKKGESLQPYDVALMLGLLKIARAAACPQHNDSWVDLAGYAACGVDAFQSC